MGEPRISLDPALVRRVADIVGRKTPGGAALSNEALFDCAAALIHELAPLRAVIAAPLMLATLKKVHPELEREAFQREHSGNGEEFAGMRALADEVRGIIAAAEAV